MSLWTCAECGCRAIAHGLGFCPQCFTPKEESMPKITSSGASNAWEPGDPEPETAPEAVPETLEPETPETPEVPEEAAQPAPDAPKTPPAAPKAAPATPKRSAPPAAPQEA